MRQEITRFQTELATPKVLPEGSDEFHDLRLLFRGGLASDSCKGVKGMAKGALSVKSTFEQFFFAFLIRYDASKYYKSYAEIDTSLS